MKKIFTFLAISALALSAGAQSTLVASGAHPMAQATITPAPLINEEDALALKETGFDFGKIPQGKPVTHVFEITNNSKDSLHIASVQASCGCTTPEWDRQKVQAPGEKTNITIGYNAASDGPFTKQITITYNGTHTKQITIKGDVWKTPATSAPENKKLENLKD